MAPVTERIVCPHCGADNPRSLIVTTCHKCRGSLAESEEPVADGGVLDEALVEAAEEVEPVAAEEAEPVAAEPVIALGPPPPEPVGPLPESELEPALVVAAIPEPEPEPPIEVAVETAPEATPVLEPAAETGSDEVDAADGDTKRPTAEWPVVPMILLAAAIAVPMIVPGLIAAGMGAASAVLTALVFVGGGVLFLFVGRAYQTSNAYSVGMDPRPKGIVDGEPFSWGATIHARKPIDLGDATIRMTGMLIRVGYGPQGLPATQPVAPARSGALGALIPQPMMEQVHRIDGRRLEAGEKIVVRAEMVLPEKIVNLPVAAGTDVHVTLDLHVPVRGFCADVRRRVNLGPIGLDPLAKHLGTK